MHMINNHTQGKNCLSYKMIIVISLLWRSHTLGSAYCLTYSYLLLSEDDILLHLMYTHARQKYDFKSGLTLHLCENVHNVLSSTYFTIGWWADWTVYFAF